MTAPACCLKRNPAEPGGVMTETEVRAGNANAAEFSGQGTSQETVTQTESSRVLKRLPLTSLAAVYTTCMWENYSRLRKGLIKSTGGNQAQLSDKDGNSTCSKGAKWKKLIIHGILNETGKFKLTTIHMLDKAEKRLTILSREMTNIF